MTSSRNFKQASLSNRTPPIGHKPLAPPPPNPSYKPSRSGPEEGRGFRYPEITRMIKFGQLFEDETIVATLSQQLSWSHFHALLPIKNALARDFYAEACRGFDTARFEPHAPQPHERRMESLPESFQFPSCTDTLYSVIALIADNLEPIRAACQRRGVSYLELVGSAARDDFDPAQRDIDVLVDFPTDAVDMFESFMGLREDLAQILGRPIDVLTARGIRNPLLLDSLQRDAIRLYAA